MRRKAIQFAGLGLLMGFALMSAVAQEVGFWDLTKVQPRQRRHEPASGSSGVLSGIMSHEAIPRGSDLDLDIVAVAADRSSAEAALWFEFTLRNTGEKPVLIPWSPHSRDVEPENASTPYRFVTLTFSAIVSDGEQQFIPGIALLYGAPNTAAPLRRLLPGEWVRIRTRHKGVKLHERRSYQTQLKVVFSENEMTSRNGHFHLDSAPVRALSASSDKKTVIF